MIELSDIPKYIIAGVSLFTKKHRRSPSHFNLKYGRENSPPESPVKEQRPPMPEPLDNKEGCEVSTTMHQHIYERTVNPLNAELNPLCYLLALLAHHFLHLSRIKIGRAHV